MLIDYSGKTFGNFGDLVSCELLTQGNYISIYLQGSFQDQTPFPKLGLGYFMQKPTTFMGLCVPKEC